jgi:hypothetical protein
MILMQICDSRHTAPLSVSPSQTVGFRYARSHRCFSKGNVLQCRIRDMVSLRHGQLDDQSHLQHLPAIPGWLVGYVFISASEYPALLIVPANLYKHVCTHKRRTLARSCGIFIPLSSSADDPRILVLTLSSESQIESLSQEDSKRTASIATLSRVRL